MLDNLSNVEKGVDKIHSLFPGLWLFSPRIDVKNRRKSGNFDI